MTPNLMITEGELDAIRSIREWAYDEMIERWERAEMQNTIDRSGPDPYFVTKLGSMLNRLNP